MLVIHMVEIHFAKHVLAREHSLVAITGLAHRFGLQKNKQMLTSVKLARSNRFLLAARSDPAICRHS